jgi:hypothetical protein
MTQPLLLCILLALGLIASLALFVTLKREMQANARKDRRRMEEIAAALRPTAQGEPPAPAIFAAPARPGFNLNRRTQAIRLLRRGESASHVSAALGVPQPEIELLIRVQKMAAGWGGGAAGSTAAER